MPRVQSISRKSSPATKWAALGALLVLAELASLAMNAGIALPGRKASGIWFARHGYPSERSNSVVIGQIFTSRGPLKMLGPASPVWEDPPVSGLIHAGQSLRTLEHGSASIALYDGSLLTLEENSYIELDSKADSTIALAMLKGGMQRRLAPAQSLAPRRPGYSPTIEIEEASAGITIPSQAEFSLRRSGDSSNRLDLRVLRGEIRLRAATGNFLLQPGEEALQTVASPGGTPGSPTSGSFEFRKMPFILLAPQTAQMLDSARAHFEWSVDPTLTSSSPLQLELSPDPDFERIVKITRIASTEPPLRHVETHMDLPEPIGDGPWYWRVRAVSDATITSDVASFWPSATPPTRWDLSARAPATATAARGCGRAGRKATQPRLDYGPGR